MDLRKRSKANIYEERKILNCYTEEALRVSLRGMKNSVKKRSQTVRKYNYLHHHDIFKK